MSGKAWFGVVFAAVVIAAAADGQDQPKPGVTPLGPDPSAVPAVLDAAGHSVLVWVGFIAAGFVAGVVYALVSGTLADRYPSRKWPIWGGLAGGSVGVWVLVGQAASWFNTVTGGLVMVTTVLVMDLALGGRRFTPPARKVPVPDESWRDVIPQSVVLGNTEALPEPRTPTWRDLQKMSWEVQQGVSVVALARSWKVEPDEIVELEAGSSRDLPEARHPREHVVPRLVPLLEQCVVAERERARPDEAHLALEDVEQLRQFIDARPPDDRADPGHALIAALCRACTVMVELGEPHRPELVHAKEPVPAPYALLHKQGRPAISARLGFTGQIGPAKPRSISPAMRSSRCRSASWPTTIFSRR